MFARTLLVVGLFFQMTLLLEAQYPQTPFGGQLQPSRRQQLQAMQRQAMQQQMQGMQGMPFEASGTIEAIGGGHVKMIDEAGNERIVSFNHQTLVTTTGEATAEFLKPGLCVEFKAEVDAKGMVSGKVDGLSVITASKENPPGVHAEGNGEPPKGAAKPATRPAAGARTKKTPTAATPGVMSSVVGHLTSVKGGKYIVKAGRATVQFELAENPKISVEMADGTLAAKGDKIAVKGMAMATMPNQGQAKEITITLSEPLGLKKKEGRSDAKLPPKAFKPGKAGGLPAPARDR